MITVNGLGKSFPARDGTEPVRVLDGISFSVAADEFLAVIGASGCGKTTMLKIVAGIVPYDAGEVLIDGRRVTGPGPDRRLVFQDFALLPWRTVMGNVEFGLEAKGVGKAERRALAAEVISRTGLQGFADYYPYQLSGGMQQRAGLARALVMKPRILLMDEPFGSLDAQTRRVLQDDLLHLVEGTGTTVVLVTHDMDEAVLLADRVLVMGRPGKVRTIVDAGRELSRPRAGAIDEIRARPAYSELVAQIWGHLQATARETFSETGA